MTNSELASLELQARIMGWEPAVTEDVVIEVPGPRMIYGCDALVQVRSDTSVRVLSLSL